MNERSTAVEQFRLSRRSLLGLGAASALGGIAAGPITRVLQYGDSIRFMLDRRSWNTEENSYFPPVPDNILSREASDRILDALNLVAENQYSHTITPEAFQVIIQRPARIASLYFHPNENKTLQETDRDFADHCVRFFTAMKSQADFMETDFIATLLMYQVSGDANSTQRAFNKDIMEERVRVALNIARKELGPIASDALINILRETELLDFAVPYYAMPRLEGVVTMGIHDIETVITARSLRDFEQTLPDKWIQVAHYLKTRAPKFFSQYGSYAEMYDQFEAESEQLKQDLMSLPQFGEYLSRLYTPEVMRRILTTDDQVDAYQLQRTTLFWANVSEINVKNGFAMQAPGRKRTEQQALERTLQQYVQAGSPIPFFLDQILNPKILQMISADANRGNTTAQELLARCKKFEADGERLIVADRAIIAALAEEQTEQDMQFQLVTGQAYVRMLLHDAYTFTHRKSPKDGKIRYDNSDELAYDAFMANGNRENSPTYQLAGTRPLHRATLPFRTPDIEFDTMQDFIEQVYRQVETLDPQMDFKKFSNYLFLLLIERFLEPFIGIKNYYPSIDQESARRASVFLHKAEAFGVDRKIITPPHCNWMRAIEATTGYINTMQ